MDGEDIASETSADNGYMENRETKKLLGPIKQEQQIQLEMEEGGAERGKQAEQEEQEEMEIP